MNGRVYAVRGNWAIEKGLMNAGPNGYIDEITQPGEDFDCMCVYRWLYNLRSLPEHMLTAKGQAELRRVRTALAELHGETPNDQEPNKPGRLIGVTQAKDQPRKPEAPTPPKTEHGGIILRIMGWLG